MTGTSPATAVASVYVAAIATAAALGWGLFTMPASDPVYRDHVALAIICPYMLLLCGLIPGCRAFALMLAYAMAGLGLMGLGVLALAGLMFAAGDPFMTRVVVVAFMHVWLLSATKSALEATLSHAPPTQARWAVAYAVPFAYWCALGQYLSSLARRVGAP